MRGRYPIDNISQPDSYFSPSNSQPMTMVLEDYMCGVIRGPEDDSSLRSCFFIICFTVCKA